MNYFVSVGGGADVSNSEITPFCVNISVSESNSLLGYANYLFLWSSGVDVSKSEITPFWVDASISESNSLLGHVNCFVSVE